QLAPAIVVVHQAMRRLDNDHSQLPVARLDDARISLLLAAGDVTRAQPAEARELFSRSETIEASDLGTPADRRHQADPLLGHQLLHDGSLSGKCLHALGDLVDLLLVDLEHAEFLFDDPAGMFGKLGSVAYPKQPAPRPGV